MRRIAAWAGLLTAIALIIICCLSLAGCGSPCDNHGGTRSYIGGVFFCNDGTRF